MSAFDRYLPSLSRDDQDAIASLLESRAWDVIKRICEHLKMLHALEGVNDTGESLYVKGQCAGRFHGVQNFLWAIQAAGTPPPETPDYEDTLDFTVSRASAEHSYTPVE